MVSTLHKEEVGVLPIPYSESFFKSLSTVNLGMQSYKIT